MSYATNTGFDDRLIRTALIAEPFVLLFSTLAWIAIFGGGF